MYMPVFSEQQPGSLEQEGVQSSPTTALDFLAVPQLTDSYCRMFNTDKWLRMHVTNYTVMENGIYCCSRGVSVGSGGPPTIFRAQVPTPCCPPCMAAFFWLCLGMLLASVLLVLFLGEVRVFPL